MLQNFYLNFSILKKLSIICFLFSYSLTAQEFVIKFATVAPEGSTWMRVMREYDKAVRQESNNRVGFKIYPGGVMGDEKDVLRKIKLGQLHSTGITGNGITDIAPKVRILDSPFLFRNYSEVDHIYQKFDKDFAQAFEDGGFILLGWAEVGFVYIFTNTNATTAEQLRGIKMWLWEGDPIAEATFNAFKLNPVPLSLMDVLTSLQTKLIEGVYISPLAAVALQWFTRVKFMINLPLANACGAVVISKQKFLEIPNELQEIVLQNGRKFMKRLTNLSRMENQRAIETIKKHGIIVIEPPDMNVVSEYEELGKQTRQHLIGKLYTEEFLNKIEYSISEFRDLSKKKFK